jgi:hypothetical protein
MNPSMRAVDPGRSGHSIKHLDGMVLGEGFESVGLGPSSSSAAHVTLGVQYELFKEGSWTFVAWAFWAEPNGPLPAQWHFRPNNSPLTESC